MVTEVSAMFVATTTCANNKQQTITKQTNKTNKQTNINTRTLQAGRRTPHLSCVWWSPVKHLQLKRKWECGMKSVPASFPGSHAGTTPWEPGDKVAVHGQEHTCSVYGKPPYSGRISSCIPFVDRLACSLREEERESEKGSRGGILPPLSILMHHCKWVHLTWGTICQLEYTAPEIQIIVSAQVG